MTLSIVSVVGRHVDRFALSCAPGEITFFIDNIQFYYISHKNIAIFRVKFQFRHISIMFSNCHCHFHILMNNNKSMFNHYNIPMNNLFKMSRFLYISILNLKWINRNIICNEQLLLGSSFQHQRFLTYLIRNTTTRSTQQTISNPDSLFTCNVSALFQRAQFISNPLEPSNKKNKGYSFNFIAKLNYRNGLISGQVNLDFIYWKKLLQYFCSIV